MTETVVPTGPVTDAVLVTLRGALAFDVGDNQAPPEPRSPSFPYATVYSLDDADRSGPYNDGQSDVVHNIQVTTVGETRDQAQRLLDFAKSAMRADAAIVVASRRVLLVEEVQGGGVERDDAKQPPYFYGISIFDITTTPA